LIALPEPVPEAKVKKSLERRSKARYILIERCSLLLEPDMPDNRKHLITQIGAIAALFAATALIGLHMAGSFLDGFFDLAFWAF